MSTRSTQNPFSLYDFLGYFLPGAILIGVLLPYVIHSANANVCQPPDKPSLLLSYVDLLKEYNLPDNHLAYIYVVLIIFSYIAGHLLSFLSALTVEKFSIWKLGYPSNYLLDGISNERRCIKRDQLIGNIVVGLIMLPVLICDGFLFKEIYRRR